MNSILQLLVTVVHFLFCVALVQGLSQLKWNWFQLEQRPLMSFQAYDDASRGAIGSIRLFVSLGWAGIVNLSVIITFLPLTISKPHTHGHRQGLATRAAAAVMISAALTSTITQQALITRSVMLPLANGTADAPRSTLLAVRSVKDINLAGDITHLCILSISSSTYKELALCTGLDRICPGGQLLTFQCVQAITIC